jgi:hypothetical protein
MGQRKVQDTLNKIHTVTYIIFSPTTHLVPSARPAHPLLSNIMDHPHADSEKGPSLAIVPVSDIELLPRDATDEEIRNLPLVVDHIPLAAWAAALVGAAERFSYYSIISIWRKNTQRWLEVAETVY